MKPEAQRIAIAEALGWTDVCCVGPFNTWGGRNADGRIASLPNFLSDLNAMHEAEKVLEEAEKVVYAETLCAILKGSVVDWGYYPGEAEIDWHSVAIMVFATAAQRAEAFLRTLNLWRDDE